MKSHDLTLRATILVLFVFVVLLPVSLLAQSGDAAAGGPKLLFSPSAPDAAQQLGLNDNCQGDVTYKVDKEGVEVTVVPNSKSSYPGVTITPPAPWDASGFGHIETKVTNEGTKNFRVNLAVYNAGTWQQNHSNVNIITVKPGQTVTLSTIFNYSYGGGSYELNTSAIIRALLFIGKSDVEQKFRFTGLIADGPKGEKPVVYNAPVNPANVAKMPPNGILFGTGVTIDTAKQIATKGAKASLSGDGKTLQVEFHSNEETVALKPAIGKWNLNRYLEVHIKLKNTGSTPLNPSAYLSSGYGKSDIHQPKAPIPAGAEGEIVVPFIAEVPEKLKQDPDQVNPEVKKTWEGGQSGTGTSYKSNVTTDVTLLSQKDGGAQKFVITSIVAQLPVFNRPDWLGKRPPVKGDWVQTLNEDFNGSAINDHLWNIYSEGEWHIGAQTHYSKDGVIVKDGKLTLRVEEKRGHHNDNPDYLVNDYQTGYADTFGKWTQRYGYYEARMKLPTAPNMFLAWWLMPDRGQASGKSTHMRAETKEGGMEFDIMETLSIWGPYRHDFGMHWDSYMKYHKSLGDFQYYVTPDKDGFITVGMLWLPGFVALYDNGVEVSRWESLRVGSVQEYMILDLATGGWEAEPMDPKQLPADFVLDYIRVWQRKDLATPEDGAKPNEGGPLFPFTPEELKARTAKP
jgi:beta-glucanase (GH16 family)